MCVWSFFAAVIFLLLFLFFGPAILFCPRYTNSYVLKTCKNIIVIQFLRKFNEPHSLFTRFNRHKHTHSLPFPLSLSLQFVTVSMRAKVESDICFLFAHAWVQSTWKQAHTLYLHVLAFGTCHPRKKNYYRAVCQYKPRWRTCAHYHTINKLTCKWEK